jgi:acyl-CoA synthetase (AMP-forming)/AMP-acid ligase II
VKGALHILGDDWEELPAGKVGRIYFSGTSRFEYFNAPEKTRERVSPQGYQTLGDIGYFDQDGFLYVTDRQDDMIISGGVNIYPQELEAALLENGEVEDCAVIGLPDQEYGERAVAFVVARHKSDARADLVSQLNAHCVARLGRVKRPKEIRIVETLPRSPTGKLLRRMLKASV